MRFWVDYESLHFPGSLINSESCSVTLWSYWILSATGNNLTSSFQFPLRLSCLIATAEVSSPVLSKRDKVWTAEIWADKNTFSFPQTRQGSLWMCCAFPLACCGMFFLLLVSLRPRSWGGYWNFVRELSDLLKIYVNFVFSSIYVLYVLHILICACSHILESRNKNNFIMADDLFNMQMNSFSKYLWMNSVFISIKDIVL